MCFVTEYDRTRQRQADKRREVWAVIVDRPLTSWESREIGRAYYEGRKPRFRVRAAQPPSEAKA